MKILFINNYFSEYGGAEKVLFSQAQLLEKNNIQVFFFASSKEPFFIENYKYKDYFPEFKEYKYTNIIKSIKNLSRIFYNKSAKSNLKKYLSEINPDLVHIHNIYYTLTTSVIDACKEMNIPVIMSVHDPRLVCPGGTLMYKGKTYCQNSYCINSHPFHCIFNRCKDSDFKLSIISTIENLFNKLNKKFDYISYFICPSLAINNLLARAGFEREKLKHIPNFLDDKFLNVQPSYENKGYFLYVGRLAKEKGITYLLKAMSILPKNIKVHIVGDGPQKLELESMAKTLNLNNVIFKGFLEGKELEEEYNNCVATILPCNWFETFGLTIIESFSYSKPVIAARVGAIPELVMDFVNGLTFEPENVEELANAIYKLHLDKDLTGKMSIESRKQAEKLYNSTLHYENLMKVYCTLLNREHSGKAHVGI